jgi:antitoxin (DNA-binding transcriptional repressor) of toxin-antitoxin stability system
MNRILTATEVKATILALLDDVAAGDEVEITKHGRVVAPAGPRPRSTPDPRGARRYRAERSGR